MVWWGLSSALTFYSWGCSFSGVFQWRLVWVHQRWVSKLAVQYHPIWVAFVVLRNYAPFWWIGPSLLWGFVLEKICYRQIDYRLIRSCAGFFGSSIEFLVVLLDLNRSSIPVLNSWLGWLTCFWFLICFIFIEICSYQSVRVDATTRTILFFFITLSS